MLFNRWIPLTDSASSSIIRVDRGHTLGRGLIHCFMLSSPGMTEYDLGSNGGDGNKRALSFNIGRTALQRSHRDGGATNFDSGVSSRYLRFDNWIVRSGQDYSISVWAYPRTKGEGSFGRIFEKGAQIIALMADGTNTATFVISGVLRTASANKLPMNTWTHIVCTQRSGVGQQMYFNGILDTGAGTGTTATTADTNQVFIGDRSSLDRNWDGRIENLRIYDRVLSEAEVRTLFLYPYVGMQTNEPSIWTDTGAAPVAGTMQNLTFLGVS